MASEKHEELVSPQYSLYPYQRQVLEDLFAALSSPERRVVAHLPTGAGKTRIASHAACCLLNASDTDDSLVIWLASTEELCEQAADELSRAWGCLGMRSANVYRFWGNRPLDPHRIQAGFLVTGLAKLRSAAVKDNTFLAYLAHKTAGVIFDEAHQAIAQTYAFVTEQLCSSWPPLLGLTATPGRAAHLSDEDYRLAEMFKHKKVSIDPKGHDNPVTFLIQSRFLADPRFIPISFESDTNAINPHPSSDYSTRDLNHLGLNNDRTNVVAELAREASSRHLRTIVFCPSVSSAQKCNEVLLAKGVLSFVITAETPTERRRSIISTFKSASRDHMVMCNYGVLTAGFDEPRTSCVIIARPTTSLVLYSQMAGRALRGPRSGGNSRAEIYTIADTNMPGFGSVVEAFTNWEELWTCNSTD